jgi:hypothetical protein
MCGAFRHHIDVDLLPMILAYGRPAGKSSDLPGIRSGWCWHSTVVKSVFTSTSIITNNHNRAFLSILNNIGFVP